MNKPIITLLIFWTIYSASFSQLPEPIDVNPKVKKELIDKLGRSWMHDQIWFDSTEYYNFFAPAYLNNDTLVDMVYYGPSGGEPLMTTIYLNEGKTLKDIKTGLGSIIKYEKPFPDTPTTLHFVEWGCCDDPHNTYQVWFIKDETLFEGEKYHFLEGTELPQTFNYLFSIRVKNTPYSLRATPEIINRDFHYHFEKGNIIAEFSTGDVGHVLSSKTDKTGRIWYFVVMESPLKVGYHNYNIYKDQKWMGWMSSNYVEIINGH